MREPCDCGEDDDHMRYLVAPDGWYVGDNRDKRRACSWCLARVVEKALRDFHVMVTVQRSVP